MAQNSGNIGDDFEQEFKAAVHGDYDSASEDLDSAFGDDLGYADSDDESVGAEAPAKAKKASAPAKSQAVAVAGSESALEAAVTRLAEVLKLSSLEAQGGTGFLNASIPKTVKDHTRKIKVTFFMEGSLDSLAQDPSRAVLGFDKKFRAFDLPYQLKEAVRSEQHMLQKITAIERKNGYPVDLVLNSAMLKENTTPGYCTAQGVQGLMVITAKEISDKPVVLYEAVTSDYADEFMSMYPNWGPKNLDQGIEYSQMTRLATVAPHHPVIGMINDARTASNLPTISAKNLQNGFYSLPSEEVKKGLAALGDEMSVRLPMRNLYEDLTFEISRGFVEETVGTSLQANQWTNAAQLIANTSRAPTSTSKRVESALAEHRSLSINMLFEIRNV